ncbi:universal stress protein [Natrialbaceae archaeon GCM10025810]|uniref:universal stress protein n=1 Tax=Halovalidus salilacus TaxID=3075124 RepID=UPI003617F2FE
MYQTLLIATDGSEASSRAVDHAIELAEQLDATLNVLSVTGEGPQAENKQDHMRTDPDAETHEAIEDVERRATDANVEVVGETRPGVPQETIINYGEEIDADVIVVGSSEKSGLDSLLSGSVAQEVVSESRIPVLTVRGPE